MCVWGATRGRVGSRRGITRSARCRRPRRSCAGRPCPPSSARRGSRWRGGGGGGAGGGRGRVEVEGGAVRSGGTSVEGDARDAPPRAHGAALRVARGLGPPPHPPHPVVLHVGDEERKGLSGERGRRRRRRRRGSSRGGGRQGSRDGACATGLLGRRVGLRRCRLRGRRAVAGRRLVLRPAALLRDAEQRHLGLPNPLSRSVMGGGGKLW